MKTLQESLKNGVVNVTFTKVDGTQRTMKCTLCDALIPPATPSENPKKKNDSVTSVWDVEKASWRSFRNDSVISFNE